MKKFVLSLLLATLAGTTLYAAATLHTSKAEVFAPVQVDDCPACALSDSEILAAGRSQNLWGAGAYITSRSADGTGGLEISVASPTTINARVTVKNDFIIIIDVID